MNTQLTPFTNALQSRYVRQWVRTAALFVALFCALLGSQQTYAQSLVNAPHAPLQDVFSLAGLRVELEAPEQRPDGSIHANRAKLVAPDELGGGSVIVNDVTVKDGAVSIGSGSFDLPRIRIGAKDRPSFEMVLSGKIKPAENGGQLISAKGDFTAPGIGRATGCDGIQVSATLEVDALGNTMLTVASSPNTTQQAAPILAETSAGPATAKEYLGVRFREASLTLTCAIPIGTTGFELRSVGGTVNIDSGNTSVSINAEIATVAKLATIPVVSASGDMTLDIDPFRLGLESKLKLFVFDVASSNAVIANNSFSASVTVQLAIVKGSATVESWVNDQGFHLTGTGLVKVEVPKGIYKKCLSFLFIKHKCAKLPPVKIPVDDIGEAEVRVGEFRNGQWGFKGTVNLLGKYKRGFYIDQSGNVTFGKVEQYQLVTREEVLAAHHAWSNAVAAGVDAAGIDATHGIEFASLADSFPLTIPTQITQTSELVFILLRDSANVQMTLIAPDGTEITPDALPDNVGYDESQIVADDADEEPVTQVSFSVSDAQPGEWQAILSGQPEPQEFYAFYAVGNPDEPMVESTEGFVAQAADATATISWQLTANNPDTRVSIYANPDPINQSLVINNSDGTTSTREITAYEGIPLALDLPTSEDNTPQSYEVDTSELESGSYHIWLEVDDGINDPVQVYLPEPLVVDHSSEWETSWTPTITATAGYEDADIAWTPHPDADVDYYTVYLGDEPGTANPEQAIDAFVVGADEEFDLLGLDGQETYYVAIAANDTGSDGVQSADAGTDDRHVLSPEVAVTTKSVDFQLHPPVDGEPLTLANGQSATTALALTDAVTEFPDPLFLYDGCQDAQPTNDHQVYLPLVLGSGSNSAASAIEQPAAIPCRESDGFLVEFDKNNFVPSGSNEFVQVTISSDSAQPGEYIIPIVAESNNTVVTSEIYLTVTE